MPVDYQLSVFHFDAVVLSVCALLLLFAIGTAFINPFFRIRFGKEEDVETSPKETESVLPPLSLVLTLHDNNKELSTLLPLLLAQNYSSEYQIIVVVEKGDAQTEEILSQFASDTRLYSTFVPRTSRYMSRTKLAITLGVKAAKYERIVLLGVTSKPLTHNWLHEIGTHFDEDVSLIVGEGKYADEAKRFYQFAHLRAACYLMRETLKGETYRTNQHFLAFRKQQFIDNDGFRGSLEHTQGAFDFLSNKYAQFGRNVLLTDRTAWVEEQTPSHKVWTMQELAYRHTRRFLSHGFKHRLCGNFDTFCLHFNYLFITAILAYGILVAQWTLVVAAVFTLLLTFCLRSIIARKAIRHFELPLSPWAVCFYEIRLSFHHLYYTFKYKCAKKEAFTSHKI